MARGGTCPRRHVQDEVEHRDAAAIRAHDLPQGGGERRGTVLEIGTDGSGQGDLGAPGAPGPGAPRIGRAQAEREARPARFRSGRQVTGLGHREPRPIGLAGVHPIVGGKGQLAHLLHRDGLHLLIGGGEGSRLQVVVAGLLDQIGHRHEGVRLLPRLLLLGPQGPHLLADQPIVLFGRTLPLGRDGSGLPRAGAGWSGRPACGWPGRAGSCPACSISQRSCRLPWPLRLVAYCSTCFQAGPVRSAAKRSSCWPQLDQELIDGRAAGIQQPQRLGLQGVGQADGKGERLGPGHGMPPPARLVCARPAVVVVGFHQEPHSHRAEPPLTISPSESTPSPGTSNERSILQGSIRLAE